MTHENITFDELPDGPIDTHYTKSEYCPYDDYDQKSDARLDPDDLSEGQIVVYQANPHGEDIPSNGFVRITDVDSQIYKLFDEHGYGIMADIHFEDEFGNSYTYMLDNNYVSGYHSGLDRVSDIARGMKFWPAEDFVDE